MLLFTQVNFYSPLGSIWTPYRIPVRRVRYFSGSLCDLTIFVSCYKVIYKYNLVNLPPVDTYAFIHVSLSSSNRKDSGIFPWISLTTRLYRPALLAGPLDGIHRPLMYISAGWPANTGASICRCPYDNVTDEFFSISPTVRSMFCPSNLDRL